MGLLGKLFVLAIVILALGYYADQKGYIDVETEFNIDTGSTGKSVLWTNDNFSLAAASPGDHKDEKVSLDVYVFNSIPLETDDGTITGYEAYLGGIQQLSSDPFNTGKRIVFSYAPGEVSTDACMHIEGHIYGSSDVTVQSGQVIHPVYIVSDHVTPIDCSTLP
ncbi:MAG: hypothetical protein GSR73_02130 [Desulfurococcales archaeon]|nr:hypothetical protein [Desulfurococcales archaeon]